MARRPERKAGITMLFVAATVAAALAAFLIGWRALSTRDGLGGPGVDLAPRTTVPGAPLAPKPR